jgi:hypothetical protein
MDLRKIGFYGVDWLHLIQDREHGGRLWEDNIKVDLSKMGFYGADWLHLTQDREHGGRLL